MELEFLSEIRQYVHKIFFVVNKTDLLDESDRREMLAFVTRTLNERMNTDDLRIFPLSCKYALSGHNDSGLALLQEELSRFLSDERSSLFLDAIARRVDRLRKSVGAVRKRAFIRPSQPAELTTVMQTRGCPVCDYLHRTVLDFLSQWQYTIATDEQAQTVFAD